MILLLMRGPIESLLYEQPKKNCTRRVIRTYLTLLKCILFVCLLCVCSDWKRPEKCKKIRKWARTVENDLAINNLDTLIYTI